VTPRILFIDHAGVLGGAELYLLDVARKYRATSTVLLFKDGPFHDRLQAENIPTHILPASRALQSIRKQGRLGDALWGLPSLARLVQQTAALARDYDVIFANSQKALIVGGLAARWAGRPMIWNLHDMLTAGHFSALNRRVAVTMANWLVDHLIVNSEATLEAFRASGGSLENTGIVYNGIDPAPFRQVSAAEVDQLCRSLSLTEAPVVGVFSRLAPWKGQDVLLNALTHLPDVQALIVGGALFGDDADYESQLRRQAEQLNLEDRVHFLGFRDDIPQLMKLADVVLHTSTAPEPFGRVIVEGMLAGTPVIASAAGGAREIIEDGVNGLLVPPDAPAPLANALTRLLSTPALVDRLTQAGQATAQTRFSRSAMLSAIEKQIQSTVAPSPATAVA
jgi:glycosyltransferase involved in cell wall biosynthesis